MRMRLNNQPLVSVLMGVYYQREDLEPLQRSIASILAQTYGELELLICDDGSIQSAKEVIDAFADRDTRIRLIRAGNKITLPEKLNVCLQHADGQLVARMDDDDYSHPDRLEKQVKYLTEHPEISFVGSLVSLWSGRSQTGVRLLPQYPQVKDFFFVQPFIHPALLFRREVLLSAGGYSEEPECELCEDYDLLLRLYSMGYRGMNIQEILLDYSAGEKCRRLKYRWNEAVTRYRRFRELGVLAKAFPYVLKPLAVGLIPGPILRSMKCAFYHTEKGGKPVERSGVPNMTEEQRDAVELLRNAELDTDQGMPEELFLLVSGLVPLANVDLLVVNRQNQVLLARRSDPFYGDSWHIPGGCMRFQESFAHRIQETARAELGCEVVFEETPLAVRNVIRGPNTKLPHRRERGHNVAILFRCSLPEGFQIQNGSRTEMDNGYLKWFEALPKDFLPIQHVFDDILEPWRRKNDEGS